jgi:cyanate permease
MVGGIVLVVGFVPTWLLMVRRPEDVGLLPDGRQVAPLGSGPGGATSAPAPIPEPVFTRGEALRTPSFWLLALYTLAVYPVQAGMSLHQAPHLIERGLSPTFAATIVSTFSLLSALSSLAFGLITRRLGVRTALVLSALFLGVSALLMMRVSAPWQGYAAACCFGIGIGGVLTVLPIAWADYFGRRSFGAIRGAALTVQVTAQASGPLLSGVLRDATGDYVASLLCFAALSFAGALIGLLARAPMPPREKATAI